MYVRQLAECILKEFIQSAKLITKHYFNLGFSSLSFISRCNSTEPETIVPCRENRAASAQIGNLTQAVCTLHSAHFPPEVISDYPSCNSTVSLYTPA